MKAHRPAAPSRWFLHHSWTKAPLVALDFETTGLDLRRDAIQALASNPLVFSLHKAEMIYDEMAAALKAYLPARLLQ